MDLQTILFLTLAVLCGLLVGAVQRQATLASTKLCPHCQTRIPILATVCPRCTREIEVAR